MVPSENLTKKCYEKDANCNLRVQKLKSNLFRIQCDVHIKSSDSGM